MMGTHLVVMRWYIWELRLTVHPIVMWVGMTRRPGFTGYYVRRPGLMRAAWWKLDLGIIHTERRTAALRASAQNL